MAHYGDFEHKKTSKILNTLKMTSFLHIFEENTQRIIIERIKKDGHICLQQNVHILLVFSGDLSVPGLTGLPTPACVHGVIFTTSSLIDCPIQ